MKKSVQLLAFALGAVTLFSSQKLLAGGDAEKGKVPAYTCKGCHGIPGYRNVFPMYRVPKIAGQSEEYIIAAINAYKNGDRQHPTMTLQANSIGDEEIANIAAYFAEFGTQQD